MPCVRQLPFVCWCPGWAAQQLPRPPSHTPPPAEHRGADGGPAGAHHLPHPAHGHPGVCPGLPEPVGAVRTLRRPLIGGPSPHVAPSLILNLRAAGHCLRPQRLLQGASTPGSWHLQALPLASHKHSPLHCASAHSSLSFQALCYGPYRALIPSMPRFEPSLPPALLLAPGPKSLSFTYGCNSHSSADAGAHGCTGRRGQRCSRLAQEQGCWVRGKGGEVGRGGCGWEVAVSSRKLTGQRVTKSKRLGVQRRWRVGAGSRRSMKEGRCSQGLASGKARRRGRQAACQGPCKSVRWSQAPAAAPMCAARRAAGWGLSAVGEGGGHLQASLSNQLGMQGGGWCGAVRQRAAWGQRGPQPTGQGAAFTGPTAGDAPAVVGPRGPLGGAPPQSSSLPWWNSAAPSFFCLSMRCAAWRRPSLRSVCTSSSWVHCCRKAMSASYSAGGRHSGGGMWVAAPRAGVQPHSSCPWQTALSLGGQLHAPSRPASWQPSKHSDCQYTLHAGPCRRPPEGSKLVMPPLTPAALCSSHQSIILSYARAACSSWSKHPSEVGLPLRLRRGCGGGWGPGGRSRGRLQPDLVQRWPAAAHAATTEGSGHICGPTRQLLHMHASWVLLHCLDAAQGEARTPQNTHVRLLAGKRRRPPKLRLPAAGWEGLVHAAVL